MINLSTKLTILLICIILCTFVAGILVGVKIGTWAVLQMQLVSADMDCKRWSVHHDEPQP